jgi:hypothetical protein
VPDTGTITVTKTLSYRYSDELPLRVEISLGFLTKLDTHGGYVDGSVLVLTDDRGLISYRLQEWDPLNATFRATLMNDTRTKDTDG